MNAPDFAAVLSDIRAVEAEYLPFDSKNEAHEIVSELLTRIGIEWDSVPKAVMQDAIGYMTRTLEAERMSGYEIGLDDGCDVGLARAWR